MGANDPAENRTLLISKMAELFHVKGKSQGSPLTESNERRQVPFHRLKKGTVLFTNFGWPFEKRYVIL